MPASEMVHAVRERENTPPKQHQGKARATKAQQDYPINVARVDPYFQVLSSSL
jgi:hypothetical protein